MNYFKARYFGANYNNSFTLVEEEDTATGGAGGFYGPEKKRLKNKKAISRFIVMEVIKQFLSKQ